MALWNLSTYFRPARDESVRLEAELLRYHPGRSPSHPPQQRQWGGDRPAVPKPMQVVRSDIRAFVLDRVGGRLRLYLDCGADRLEIGASLGETEREWRFDLLQGWHAPSQKQLA